MRQKFAPSWILNLLVSLSILGCGSNHATNSRLTSLVSLSYDGMDILPEPETSESEITGTFIRTVAENFESHTSAEIFSLKTSDQTYTLSFSDDVPTNLVTGSQITVRGVMSWGEMLKSSSDKISVRTAALSAQATTASVTGSGRVGVVLFNYANDRSRPFTRAQIAAQLFTNPISSKAWFNEVSYGLYQLTGSIDDVFDWVELPINKPTTDDCTLDNLGTAQASDALWHLNPSFHESDYKHLIFITPDVVCRHLIDGEPREIEGFADIGGTKIWIRGGVELKNFANIANHEIGHSLGLRHASALDCSAASQPFDITSSACRSVEYGDRFDTMGSASASDLHHFNFRKKLFLGWVTSSRAREASTSGLYTLGRIEDAQPSSGYASIRVLSNDGSNSKYDAEYHTGAKLLNRTFPYVVIHQGVDVNYMDERSHLLSGFTMGGDGISARAMPWLGTFVDPVRHLTIRTDSSTPSSATIQVDTDCARMPPTITFVGSPTFTGSANRTASIGMVVRNYDQGPDCRTSTVYSVIGTNSAHGTFSASPEQYTVPPGGMATFTVSFSIPAGTWPNTYQIFPTVNRQFGNGKAHAIGMRTISYQVTCGTSSNSLAASSTAATSDSCVVPTLSTSVNPSRLVDVAGTAATYQMSVKNTGSTMSSYDVSVVLPAGWTSSVSTSSLQNIVPGQSRTATFTIYVPSDAEGTFPLSFLAADRAGSSNRSISLAEFEVGEPIAPGVPELVAPTVQVNPQSQNGAAGSSATYQVNVTNQNSEVTTFYLNARLPSTSWYGSFFPSALSLAPGETGSAELTVYTPTNIATGNYSIGISAQNVLDPANTRSTSATFIVGTCLSRVDPSLTLSPTTFTGTPGTTATYQLNVKNNDSVGCGWTYFSLSASIPEGWLAEFEYPGLWLPAGYNGSVDLYVTPAGNASVGISTIHSTVFDVSDSSRDAAGDVTYTVVAPQPWTYSIRSGDWSDPGTWNENVVPSSTVVGRVTMGHTVTVNTTAAVAKQLFVQGRLQFSRTVSSRLTIGDGDLKVVDSGWLDMGTESSPIPAGIIAELVFTTGPSWIRFIVEGKFTMRGNETTPTSFASIDAPVGTSTIKANPIPRGWGNGSDILIDDERRTVSYMSPGAGGLRLYLSSPLEKDHFVRNTVRLANLSRNSRILTVTAAVPFAQIRNFTPGNIDINYGEIAGFRFMFWEDFYNRPTPGSIRNSVFRDCPGYSSTNLNYAISASTPDRLLISGNTFYNNMGGILLGLLAGGGHNIIEGNYFIKNTALALGVSGTSVNDTIASNVLFANAIGTQFDGANSIVASNTIYDHASIGLRSGRSVGSLLSNYSYGNGNDLQTIGTVYGGAIGYDRAGNSRPSLQQEISLPSLGPTLKGVKVNPTNRQTGGIYTSILSYNQSGDLGSVRFWGNATLSRNVFSEAHLDENGQVLNELRLVHSEPLYRSKPTLPVLMIGVGHSAIVNSTFDEAAVSQLISIARSNNQWEVRGSESGLLGTFSGSIQNQSFPEVQPQFNISFTEGNVVHEGDRIDFGLKEGSRDAGHAKKLLFGSSDSVARTGQSQLVVGVDGKFVVEGESVSNPSIIDRIDDTSSYYRFQSVGNFSLTNTIVKNVSASGIQFQTGGAVQMNNVSFDEAGQDASGISSYVTTVDLANSATFSGLTFFNSRPSNTLYNIRVTGSDTSLNWTNVNYGGPLGGAAYSSDPHARVRWFEGEVPTPTPTPQPIDNGTVEFVSAPPASVEAGASFTVVALVTNTGTTLWSDANGYRLGYEGTGSTWGSTQWSLGAGVTVAPRQSILLTKQIVAPNVAGTYVFAWQVYRSGVGWIGQGSPSFMVQVTSPPSGGGDTGGDAECRGLHCPPVEKDPTW